MLRPIRDCLRTRARENAAQHYAALALVASLLGAACTSVWAAEELHDCIAIARSKGAILVVDKQPIEVPVKGMIVERCESARFNKAAVRLHYLGKAGVPIVDRYDSKSDDDGHEVSERVTIAASIGAFIRAKPEKPTTSVTGGQYTLGPAVGGPVTEPAGLFTVRKAKNGETYAMMVLDPSSEYAQERPLTNLMIDVASAQPDTQPLKLDGQACGVLWGKINCGTASSEPGFKAFMAYEYPKEFKVGETYSLSAKDRALIQVVFVPPEYLKRHYQGEFAVTPAMATFRLEQILWELSISTMLKNEEAIANAKGELARSFPQIVSDTGGSR